MSGASGAGEVVDDLAEDDVGWGYVETLGRVVEGVVFKWVLVGLEL